MLTNSLAKGTKRMVTKVQWPCWRSMSHTIERGDPLYATHQMHDNWVAYSRIWSRRSLHRFYGRAQTYGNRPDVWNSRKPLHVTQTFETKILRLEWFAQVNLISVAPPQFGLILNHKNIRSPIVQCRRNWSIFFVMEVYLETMMERLNSGE